MPFLSSNSGHRKKKSHIHGGMEQDESLVRREMVKQKLYAAHMMDDNDDSDAYLQLRLGPASPRKQKGQHHHLPHRHLHRRSSKSNLDKMKQLDRRSSAPNYIDHSGSLAYRKPPKRSHSETTGRPASSKPMRGTAPPLKPKRVQSAHRISPKGSGELPLPPTSPNGVANAKFSATPGRRNRRLSQTSQKSIKILLSPSPRDSPRTYDSYDDVEFHEDPADEDDANESESSDDVPSLIPLRQAPPRQAPSRRRRATVTGQSLQKSADAAMRFGPPRKIKSYYPGANKPRNNNFHMNTIDKNESLDISNHSNKGEKGGFRRGGLFRRKSGNSDDTEDTASSSDRSSSFFRSVRRTNSASMKRSISSLKPSLKKSNNSTPLLSSLTTKSDHSTDSQYTSGGNSRNSAPPELQSDRRKTELYNSAIQRAKERQALKRNRNHPNLSEQLSKLPSSTAEGKAEYDFIIEDDDKEDKGIFSSLISKIEDIYDDCS